MYPEVTIAVSVSVLVSWRVVVSWTYQLACQLVKRARRRRSYIFGFFNDFSMNDRLYHLCRYNSSVGDCLLGGCNRCRVLQSQLAMSMSAKGQQITKRIGGPVVLRVELLCGFEISRNLITTRVSITKEI